MLRDSDASFEPGRRLRAESHADRTGYGTQNGYGRALEATTLAINGQAAISVYGPRPGPDTARLPPAPGVAPQPR
jgi:hypothetical protein